MQHRPRRYAEHMHACPPTPAAILDLLGLSDRLHGRITLHGTDPVVKSPHKLGEATASILAARAGASAALWQARGGGQTDIDIDVADAVHALHATNYIWMNGHKIDIHPTGNPITGRFRCKDGRFIFLIAGPPYLKLLNGYLNFFDCGNTKVSISREVAAWDSLELETALNEAGLPATIARSQAEWCSHPQGRVLAAQPVIQLERIGDADPTPLPVGGAAMEGLRVLDWTHVLAGPTAAKELARAGANTLAICSPNHLDPLLMALWGNHGKRSCFLDFANAPDRDVQQAMSLADDADVMVYSWRPSVADRFGLSIDALLQRPRTKGLIYVDINCYGWGGPWDDRGGFDHCGQMVSGFSVSEGNMDDPCISPVGYLNDLLTGHLAATGAMAAVLRRAEEGGSWRVRVSLARTAMWVQSLGLLPRGSFDEAPDVPSRDDAEAQLTSVPSPLGEVTYLADPVRYSAMPSTTISGPGPFGSDPASW